MCGGVQEYSSPWSATLERWVRTEEGTKSSYNKVLRAKGWGDPQVTILTLIPVVVWRYDGPLYTNYLFQDCLGVS